MNITSSMIGMAILESHVDVPALASSLKTMIGDVMQRAEATRNALEKEGKKLMGLVYSGSLFDDATDNIFYQVHIGQTTNGKDYYADVRFVHNATQLFTGLSVTPTNPNANPGEYSYACMNNVTFPRHLTHLLAQSITKLKDELALSYDQLADVIILEADPKVYRV